VLFNDVTWLVADRQMMRLGRKDLKKLKAQNSWLFAVGVTM
jgi:hypothetical protein